MSREAMKLALEALEGMYIQGFTQDDSPINNAIIALREELAKPDFWEGYVPEPVKPAQQEPKIDIYRSFEQWKRGNVLEHGVPRTEHYSEAQLDLVEMGWNYGYDAGRAVEQALDKKAENARELGLDYEPAQQEPFGYFRYDLRLDAWVQNRAGTQGTPFYTSPPAQRKPMTDEEIEKCYETTGHYQTLRPQDRFAVFALARAIEAKLKEKNGG